METKKQLRKKYSDLQFEYNVMESENAELRRLLQSARAVEEKGCKRGNYCRACVHSVLVGQHCYCTFGECENYKKDPEYVNDIFNF